MSSVPELFEADWEREQVTALFDDLASGASIEHVQARLMTDLGPRDVTITLDQAKQHFASGEAKAIQIRYQFDDVHWCDTLMVMADTVRIIRTTLPS